MKQKRYIKVKLIFIAIGFATLQIGCSDDAPAPTNEIIDKGHDDWSKVEFKFTEGQVNMHEGKNYRYVDNKKEEDFFHGMPEIEDLKFKTVQTYAFISTKEGVKIVDKTPIRLVGGQRYGLEITYYNKQGKRINGEFTTKEMAPLHQHFFVPKDIKAIKEDITPATKENILDYKYRDTNPENGRYGEKGVVLRGEDDPIGLKGFFEVKKPYQEFSLKITLIHVIRGSKLSDSGKPYPFHSPSPRLLGSTDLSVKIPIKIFTDYPKESSEEPIYKADIAKEFNMSLQQVEQALKKRMENAGKGNYKL